MILKLLTMRSVQIILLLMLLFAATDLLINDPAVVQSIRLTSFDTYNRLVPRKPGDGVAIIDLDEESLKQLGQWPWPRTVVGDIPVLLKQLGAKSVAFDIVFSEPDRTSPAAIAKTIPLSPATQGLVDTLARMPDNDAVFAQKLRLAGNAVLGFVPTDRAFDREPVSDAGMADLGVNRPDFMRFVHTSRYFATPVVQLGEASAGNGSFGMEPEVDGIVRRVPLLMGLAGPDGRATKAYPSLALEALRVALGVNTYNVYSVGQRGEEGYGIQNVKVGKYVIPTDETGMMWVYYTGHRPSLYIPAWKLLKGQVGASAVKDKVVFVGTSAIGLLDLRSSPLNRFLPGVEVHAEMVEQMLGGQFLQRTHMMMIGEIILTVVISLGVIFLAPFVGAWVLALLIVALVSGGVYGCFQAYQTAGWLLDPLCPSIVVVVIFVISSILTNLRTELEKRQIRLAFGHYISPVLIEELAKNPDKLKLGGEVRELTVMFTDIRNFTSISETMDPAELIRMMNDFLTPMTSAVLDNRGTVDKYMGDAMMTFWNAPLDDALHARNACKASLEMVRALGPVNVELKARAEKANRKFIELKAGIGIHSGKASVGNMGSKQRFAYSALGDTVNLASRMEGQTKSYGIAIMMSHTTHAQVTEMASIELDLLAVKGRAEAERVYALLGDAAEAKTEVFVVFAKLHDEMLAAYRAQNWDKAKELGEKCAILRPDLAALYQLYLSRIETYRQHPPGADWTGVWVAKEK